MRSEDLQEVQRAPILFAMLERSEQESMAGGLLDEFKQTTRQFRDLSKLDLLGEPTAEQEALRHLLIARISVLVMMLADVGDNAALAMLRETHEWPEFGMWTGFDEAIAKMQQRLGN